MTIIVQSMGILLVELNFRRRIYPEVLLLAKLFQNIKSIGFLPFRKIKGPQDSRMILKTRPRVLSWIGSQLRACASVRSCPGAPNGWPPTPVWRIESDGL
jgi:hypothetical protein